MKTFRERQTCKSLFTAACLSVYLFICLSSVMFRFSAVALLFPFWSVAWLDEWRRPWLEFVKSSRGQLLLFCPRECMFCDLTRFNATYRIMYRPVIKRMLIKFQNANMWKRILLSNEDFVCGGGMP